MDKNFTYNPTEPLALHDRETKKSNKALNDYYLMGEYRSLEKLFNLYAKSDNPTVTRLQTLKDWSSKYRWQNRIRDYDAMVNQTALLSRQEALIKFTQQYEDKAMQAVNQLLEKANEILNTPLSDSNWSIDTAARLVATADKIARLTSKSETEITQVNIVDADSIKEKILNRIAQESAT